jgi:hypothetical protein
MDASSNSTITYWSQLWRWIDGPSKPGPYTSHDALG